MFERFTVMINLAGCVFPDNTRQCIWRYECTSGTRLNPYNRANPTGRLKAAVVCSGVTYCGPTMRVPAFMIRICVWHSFRARGEIFSRCRNVARTAVMTRLAGRNSRVNGEREFELWIFLLPIKTGHGLSCHGDFFFFWHFWLSEHRLFLLHTPNVML